jgi:threonine/homoserine/homoserine lactone efflux protein
MNLPAYFFMFCAAWSACGIGAGPGFLLSTDTSMHKPFLAASSAMMGIFMSVIGWICLLVGQRKLLRGLEQKQT